ncbi:transcriptional regulator LeuO [Vibrio barjaei]|uniref:transcriptional regulator LeuO n=1 Tax=Vibrio barjaei TaxID=1676683 RepID=UPI002283AE79|nr:transcriptional regulator LeuO [Vibrio barjaei]MCY9870339.1 transcriptional regulator LeuO [Vibrio barjaei]
MKEAETEQNTVPQANELRTTLKHYDLNLLPVFDAVMQEQNITRASKVLKMSQPAVSNAVARLKKLFDDELFMRQGRGIMPTQRARELFGPIRQCLQIIRNELPDFKFIPKTTERTFSLSIGSPLDLRLSSSLMSRIKEEAPCSRVTVESCVDRMIFDRLKLQEIDFSIDYTKFELSEYSSHELFEDELVVIASKEHTRISEVVTKKQLEHEEHARISGIEGDVEFARAAYSEISVNVGYRAQNVLSLLKVVEETELVAIVPMWLLEMTNKLKDFQVLDCPLKNNTAKCYLTWHKASEKDKGHVWLRDQIMEIANDVHNS